MSDTPSNEPKCPFPHFGARHEPFEHVGMYSFFSEVRPEARVFYSPEIDYWVVTHHADIKPVIQDSEHFSATLATRPICPWP